MESAAPSERKGPALLDDFNATREKIQADFLRCFAARAPQDPRFAEAVKLAQALYAGMPER